MTTEPFGGFAGGGFLDVGAMGAKGSVIGRDPEHVGDFDRGFALLDPKQVRGERHEIASDGAGREVRPPAGGQVHLETALATVSSSWVDCHPFGTLAAAVRKPP